MAAMSNKPAKSNAQIAENRRARHDYFVEERYEAGIALEGWEVKSLRAGKAQLVDSYVIIKNGEAWLLGALINPLPTVSTHFIPDPQRTRKLLLHRNELDKLIGLVERKGYTLIAMSLYWKNGRAKVNLAVARGKQSHDKREVERDKDWQRERQRIMKKGR
jgi:SsrA-binding protein